MSFSDRTMTEPYTSREVSTVPGEGDANLLLQDSKAAAPYSTRPLHWMLPCSKSSSKSKKPCANTRTRPFPPNRNRLSCQTTACWYSSRQADYTDRSYFYLPTPQNLSTKSARTVEKFSRPGAFQSRPSDFL